MKSRILKLTVAGSLLFSSFLGKFNVFAGAPINWRNVGKVQVDNGGEIDARMEATLHNIQLLRVGIDSAPATEKMRMLNELANLCNQLHQYFLRFNRMATVQTDTGPRQYNAAEIFKYSELSARLEAVAFNHEPSEESLISMSAIAEEAVAVCERMHLIEEAAGIRRMLNDILGTREMLRAKTILDSMGSEPFSREIPIEAHQERLQTYTQLAQNLRRYGQTDMAVQFEVVVAQVKMDIASSLSSQTPSDIGLTLNYADSLEELAVAHGKAKMHDPAEWIRYAEETRAKAITLQAEQNPSFDAFIRLATIHNKVASMCEEKCKRFEAEHGAEYPDLVESQCEEVYRNRLAAFRAVESAYKFLIASKPSVQAYLDLARVYEDHIPLHVEWLKFREQMLTRKKEHVANLYANIHRITELKSLAMNARLDALKLQSEETKSAETLVRYSEACLKAAEDHKTLEVEEASLERDAALARTTTEKERQKIQSEFYSRETQITKYRNYKSDEFKLLAFQTKLKAMEITFAKAPIPENHKNLLLARIDCAEQTVCMNNLGESYKDFKLIWDRKIVEIEYRKLILAYEEASEFFRSQGDTAQANKMKTSAGFGKNTHV